MVFSSLHSFRICWQWVLWEAKLWHLGVGEKLLRSTGSKDRSLDLAVTEVKTMSYAITPPAVVTASQFTFRADMTYRRGWPLIPVCSMGHRTMSCSLCTMTRVRHHTKSDSDAMAWRSLSMQQTVSWKLRKELISPGWQETIWLTCERIHELCVWPLRTKISNLGWLSWYSLVRLGEYCPVLNRRVR